MRIRDDELHHEGERDAHVLALTQAIQWVALKRPSPASISPTCPSEAARAGQSRDVASVIVRNVTGRRARCRSDVSRPIITSMAPSEIETHRAQTLRRRRPRGWPAKLLRPPCRAMRYCVRPQLWLFPAAAELQQPECVPFRKLADHPHVKASTSAAGMLFRKTPIETSRK